MDDAALGSLLSRLEQAEGPSRLLDAEIAVAIFRAADPDALRAEAAESDCEPGTYWMVHRDGWRSLTTSQKYTSSLDAAMGLVPEGWFLKHLGERTREVMFVGDQHSFVGWEAEIQYRDGGGRLQGGCCENREIALVIAALKAHRARSER